MMHGRCSAGACDIAPHHLSIAHPVVRRVHARHDLALQIGAGGPGYWRMVADGGCHAVVHSGPTPADLFTCLVTFSAMEAFATRGASGEALLLPGSAQLGMFEYQFIVGSWGGLVETGGLLRPSALITTVWSLTSQQPDITSIHKYWWWPVSTKRPLERLLPLK